MVRRDAFIWEIIRESTLLRDEIAEIEKIDDTDELVEGLLKFYRGFDEVVEDFVAMMQMITAKPDFDTMVRNLPATFMNKFIEQGYRPTKVSFKSLHLFATLDFLNKHTSTKANLAIRLPAHQSALESLLEDMSKRH